MKLSTNINRNEFFMESSICKLIRVSFVERLNTFELAKRQLRVAFNYLTFFTVRPIVSIPATRSRTGRVDR